MAALRMYIKCKRHRFTNPGTLILQASYFSGFCRISGFYSLIFLGFRLKVLIFPCIFHLTGLYRAANADLSGMEKLGQYYA